MLHPKLRLPSSIEEYGVVENILRGDDKILAWNTYWVLARWDLFFLVKYVLSTSSYFTSANNGIQNESWIFDRCREVQASCDRVLDVWARFHWKSNIKTLANIIRYILIDPDYTFLILSHTRPIAKTFLAQIQREVESNRLLQTISYHPALGEQIFPNDPKNLPRNSLDEGLIVNRLSNPREATVSAFGLVDSLPTSGHWKVRAYDDVVTKDSVTSSDMINKTTHAWELSLPLGMPNDEAWYTGTFYASDDTYHEIARRGAQVRIRPCYEIDEEHSVLAEDGTYDEMEFDFDQPVLYEKAHLQRLFEEMGAAEGSRNAALQMLCDAKAGLATGFKQEWLKFYQTDPVDERQNKNVLILVDPANEKKKNSDYTSMWVVGLGGDQNLYILDGLRDRLSLHERANALFDLHARWQPYEVRYESYGLQADIGHIQYVQDLRGYRFNIEKVAGNVRKEDRIGRLVPLFSSGRIYLPLELWYTTIEGERIDLVKTFIKEEYARFPNSLYKDMLDSLARLCEPDLPLMFPMSTAFNTPKDRWEQKRVARLMAESNEDHGWMAG